MMPEKEGSSQCFGLNVPSKEIAITMTLPPTNPYYLKLKFCWYILHEGIM